MEIAMNKIQLLFFICLNCVVMGCFAQHPEAMITLHVVTQDGVSVGDVKIAAGFEDGRTLNGYYYERETDKDGLATFRSEVIGRVGFANILNKTVYKPDAVDTYYATHVDYEYGSLKTDVQDGKWQPWNPTIEMILKEIKNPIPMYVHSFRALRIPARNQWIAFDMMKNDWLTPFGKGEEADIMIYYEWDESHGKDFSGIKLKMRFNGPKSGFYRFKCDTFSAFKSPYMANPDATYEPEIIFTILRDPITGNITRTFLKEDEGLIFRTRTRVDDEGNLVSARYGKIYRHSQLLQPKINEKSEFRLQYYLNPNENDLNLEFDPTRNLHEGSQFKRRAP